MAKRKTIEGAEGEAVANPESASDQAPPKADLPSIDSPSISPAKLELAAEPVVAETPTEELAAPKIAALAPANHPRFIFRPRHKRYALLAASVALAAALGAAVGVASSSGISKPAVAVEESKATQQSVARLHKEIDGLKASLEAANKSAYSQIAKISERLNREGADITGSVAPPQTVPATPQAAASLQIPRAAASAIETQPPRLPIVADWSIREARDGYVYVQGHGDVYQVVPGAPLPGLGPVEQIKRQDGRWLVVTPKGIIVSMRDRRYFEQF
jgi:hypothetical protein